MIAPKLPSKRASSFKKLYAQLPESIQQEADEAYRQFKIDPDHPGLNFKQIVGIYYSAQRVLVRVIAQWLRSVKAIGCGSGSGHTQSMIIFSTNCGSDAKVFDSGIRWSSARRRNTESRQVARRIIHWEKRRRHRHRHRHRHRRGESTIEGT